MNGGMINGFAWAGSPAMTMLSNPEWHQFYCKVNEYGPEKGERGDGEWKEGQISHPLLDAVLCRVSDLSPSTISFASVLFRPRLLLASQSLCQFISRTNLIYPFSSLARPPLSFPHPFLVPRPSAGLFRDSKCPIQPAFYRVAR